VAFLEQVIGAASDDERQVDYRQGNPGKPGQVAGVAASPDSSFPRQVCRGIYPLRMAGR